MEQALIEVLPSTVPLPVLLAMTVLMLFDGSCTSSVPLTKIATLEVQRYRLNTLVWSTSSARAGLTLLRSSFDSIVWPAMGPSTGRVASAHCGAICWELAQQHGTISGFHVRGTRLAAPSLAPHSLLRAAWVRSSPDARWATVATRTSAGSIRAGCRRLAPPQRLVEHQLRLLSVLMVTRLVSTATLRAVRAMRVRALICKAAVHTMRLAAD